LKRSSDRVKNFVSSWKNRIKERRSWNRRKRRFPTANNSLRNKKEKKSRHSRERKPFSKTSRRQNA